MSTQPLIVLRYSEVFVPGGLPKHTYFPRDARKLEARLRNVTDEAHKLVVVTGDTKSGKTVLVKTVLKDRPQVWLEGGRIHSWSDFLQQVGDLLGIIEESTSTITLDRSHESANGTSVEADAHVLKASKEIHEKDASKREISTENKQIVSAENQVAYALQTKSPLVVIDDFHYIKRELQGEVTRFFKALIFNGLAVIYIVIPQRRYDADKVEREMGSRIAHITIPPWTVTELLEISQRGFPLLHVIPNLAVSRHLGFHANYSPHLMQEFCREICIVEKFEVTEEKARAINPVMNYELIFKTVAEECGQYISDKIVHTVSEEQRVLYVAILRALSTFPPSTTTVSLHELKKRMRDFLSVRVPSDQEIAKVLRRMSAISSADDSSVTVLDYEEDEEKLHITDPFFAFFLKWGKDLLVA